MNNNTELQQQFTDIEAMYYKEQGTGLSHCPCCGNDVPHNQMTASVTRGIICWDCDIKL